AARRAGVTDFVDPRPVAVGSIRTTFEAYPHIGPVLPAMGYGAAQLADLGATIDASGCDVVVNGSPFRLSRLLDLDVEIRDAVYRYADDGGPTLGEALAPWIDRWSAATG
ncbi:MAG: GTPase, partial [Acidimicrobiia bacterium]